LEDAHGILSNLGMQPKGDIEFSYWFKPWTKDKKISTLQFVDELFDDSIPSHSNSILQPFPSMVLDDNE
jgi:hypothetical protein